VAPGVSFNAGSLQGKSSEALSLQQYSLAVAMDAVEALESMAGSAGHPGLASALTDATERGNKAFTSMIAAYGHAYKGLVSTAQILGDTEQANAGLIGGVGNQDIPFLNGIG
jgi:hypothetical protein